MRHLERGAYALMLNTVLGSVLGLAYWVVVARLYNAESVGRNAALVSAMMTVSSIATINLPVALPRLLPSSHGSARALVITAYSTNLATGSVAGTLFVTLAPQVSSQLDFLTGSVGAAFIFGVVLWGIFSMQDGVLIGMRCATWVPMENAVFGVSKVAAAALLALVATDYGVFFSWVLPVAVLVAPVNLLLFSRVLPVSGSKSLLVGARVLAASGLRRLLVSDYLASLLHGSYFAFLPLYLLARLGPEENAYFFAPFTIAFAIFTLSVNMATSLTVEGTLHHRRVAALARHSVRRLAFLLMPIVAVTAIAAPLVLEPFGREYAQAGSATLRLLVLASVPHSLIAIYMSLLRVHSKGMMLAVEGGLTVLVVGLSLVLVPRLSITGAALAWCAAHAIVAVAVLPHLRRQLQADR